MIIPPELLEDFKTLQSPLKDTTILWHRPGHQPLFPEHDKKEGWINIHCLNEGEETPQSMDAETIILKAVGLHGEWNVDVINKMVSASIASKQATIGPAHAAWYLFIFGTENPTEGHFSLAGKLLEIEGIKNSDEWRVKFGTSIWEKCTNLIKHLEKSKVPLNAVDDGEKFVPQHRAFLEYIGTLKGGHAKHELKTLRSIKDGRWDLFKPLEKSGYAPRFAVSLAYICLEDEIRPAIERMKKNRPALPLVVAEHTEAICGWSGRITITDNLIKNDSRLLGEIPIAALDEKTVIFLENYIHLLSAITGHRVIRGVVTKCHEQHFSSYSNASILHYPGGIEEFAKSIECNNGRQIEEVRKILRAGNSFHFKMKDLEIGGLWTYASNKEHGLEIRLGSALEPKFALKNLSRHNRMLVPMVPMPTLINPDKLKKNQAGFQFGLVRYFVDHRGEIRALGGVPMTMDEMKRLGSKYGLPGDTVARLLDRWLHDGDDGERVLECRSGLWHLADNSTYGAARRYIDEGARCGEAKKRKVIKGKVLAAIEVAKGPLDPQ